MTVMELVNATPGASAQLVATIIEVGETKLVGKKMTPRTKIKIQDSSGTRWVGVWNKDIVITPETHIGRQYEMKLDLVANTQGGADYLSGFVNDEVQGAGTDSPPQYAQPASQPAASPAASVPSSTPTPARQSYIDKGKGLNTAAMIVKDLIVAKVIEYKDAQEAVRDWAEILTTGEFTKAPIPEPEAVEVIIPESPPVPDNPPVSEVQTVTATPVTPGNPPAVGIIGQDGEDMPF